MTTPTMMSTFQIRAIPPATLERYRRDGRDGAGNPLAPFRSLEGGEPLRCCLRLARIGEQLALIAHQPPGGAGAYQETGPVFVHAAACQGYPESGGWPPEFRHRQQVLRGYDRLGRIAAALPVDGVAAEDGIAKLLSNPDIITVQSRNPLYGCYMFEIRRTP